MCLIELQYAPKLVISCGVAGVNYMRLITDSSRVREVRESILELLLLNHPLDCPVCDQGSECDLQDIVMLFSSDRSRFYNFGKKIIIDGYIGPFVRTKMSRCIHCTRCVRYMFYLIGVMDFFVLGRGIAMRISNYLVKILESEMSGNVIDLCPVGFFSGKRPR